MKNKHVHRWTAHVLGAWPWAALPIAGGCAQFLPPTALLQSAPIIRAAAPDEPKKDTKQAKPSAADEPPPKEITELPQPAPAALAVDLVPVSLDTVFRLAEEQNPRVALARERVNEAFAEKDAADSRWLPDIYVGTAYYRHEGGIQSFQGPLIRSSTGAMFGGVEFNSQLDLREFAFQKINARRKVLQQRGELRQVTTETTLEAANAYIDLLTALSGEVVARQMVKDLLTLLTRAKELASKEPGARVVVVSIQTELDDRQQTLVHLRHQAEAASAKLSYLLGVESSCVLQPVDTKLLPLELVDATPPTCQLVQQALSNGPGVQEMESLLNLIQESIAQAQGPGRYLPIFGVRMAEGAFGAGAGAQLTWDNRFDLGLQARWNLTEYVTRCERRRVAQSKIQQAHFAYHELRNKLTAGVHEARSAVHHGREQIRLGESQVSNAARAFQLSDERKKINVPDSSYTEVLLAIRALAGAHLNHLNAINAFDKAQIRLLVLLGPAVKPIAQPSQCSSTPISMPPQSAGNCPNPRQ